MLKKIVFAGAATTMAMIGGTGIAQAAPDNDVAILVCSVPQGIGAPDNAVTDAACETS